MGEPTGKAEVTGNSPTASAPTGPDSPVKAAVASPNRRAHWGGMLLLIGIWMVFMASPLTIAATQSTGWRRVLGLTAGIAFVLVYFGWMVWLNGLGRSDRPPLADRHGPAPRWTWAPWWVRTGMLVLLTGLAAAAVPGSGSSALTYGVFIVVTAVATMQLRVGVPVGVAMLVTCLAVYVWVPAAHGNASGAALGTLLGGLAVAAGRRAGERGQALQEARERMTELAIAAERERMARDLHDILGHSLTVIAMKSELAGRLAEMHAPTAVAEINDVERLARQALADVRATINGSREVTLATELVNARSALTAAGIEADLPRAVDDVGEKASELFGWVVREGVTNVIRHSGASRCLVSVGTDYVELCDDGSGPTIGESSGRGLRGLRERAAAANGALTVARSGAGGMRLRVDLRPANAVTPVRAGSSAAAGRA